METLARGLRSSLAARRAAVGWRLLLMYEIARRANREGEAPYIQAVEQMERVLRLRRHGRKAAPESAPEADQNVPD